jgi:hypothetical protein
MFTQVAGTLDLVDYALFPRQVSPLLRRQWLPNETIIVGVALSLATDLHHAGSWCIKLADHIILADKLVLKTKVGFR